MKVRYFQHVDGFDGETKTLGFLEDGRVIGYDEKGKADPWEFTGFYTLDYALKNLSLGVWKEIEHL